MRAWILTDGKIGDKVQCLGVMHQLGIEAEDKVIHPGKPWEWLMPRGPVPPGHRPDRPGSPIAPPFPDIAIATGRRMVPYLRALHRAAGGRTFTVFLKDPRTASTFADLVWVPRHDRLRSDNVLVTDTAPHNIRKADIDAAVAARPTLWDTLPEPRLGLMIGNPLARAKDRQKALDAFLSRIDGARGQVGSMIITPSRRTPPELLAALETRLSGFPHWTWNGEEPNPYRAILGFCDFLAVTSDSHNMVGEALYTGKPVFPIPTDGLNPKLARFLKRLGDDGLVRAFDGPLVAYAYQPVDATKVIADAIRAAMEKRNTRQ